MSLDTSLDTGIRIDLRPAELAALVGMDYPEDPVHTYCEICHPGPRKFSLCGVDITGEDEVSCAPPEDCCQVCEYLDEAHEHPEEEA
jgi:hypothetical protein